MPLDDGGPAFPDQVVDSRAHGVVSGAAYGFGSGMSLRDYFAAAAFTECLKQTWGQGWDEAAECAYLAADAMLAARGAK